MSTPEGTAVRRALVSVSDKTGLVERARRLAELGVELVSTGGTAAALRDAGLAVEDVAALTRFPEMMDGRLKTLHPVVHGGILFRRDLPDHQQSAEAHGIPAIDLVWINLYPFEATVRAGGGAEDCIENIDIGGPAMLRAAAKNAAFVCSCTDLPDVDAVLSELARDGVVSAQLKRRLAAKTYSRTAAYDAAISEWYLDQVGEEDPEWRAVGGRLRQPLRYGENPHQKAGLYAGPEARPGVMTARQVQGKELSYINILDADAAFELVAEFDPARIAACAVIKHANPCGVAEGADLKQAYLQALACDPLSRFGGIIAFNRTLDAETAELVSSIVTDVIIVPDATAEALVVLEKRKNTRVLLAGGLPDPRAPAMLIRSVAGGFLLQSRDTASADAIEMKVVTRRPPTDAEIADMHFAFRVCKHTKSNAIIYAKNGATVGIGAGQMSRLDSARIARRKASDEAQNLGLAEPATVGSVCASDAFFPFADGLNQAAEAGVTAVIQPGGSLRDAEVIEAADKAGLAMVFTGVRQFRH